MDRRNLYYNIFRILVIVCVAGLIVLSVKVNMQERRIDKMQEKFIILDGEFHNHEAQEEK